MEMNKENKNKNLERKKEMRHWKKKQEGWEWWHSNARLRGIRGLGKKKRGM